MEEDDMTGHVARMGEMRNTVNISVGKPEGKRPPGRPRRRWKINFRMDLTETGLEGADWMHLAEDRGQWWATVIRVMNLRVP
jgi:hypothetical protein